MGHPVHLPARRLEQHRRSDAAVDVAERGLAVGIQSPGMRLRPGDVGVDGRRKARFAQLAEHDACEVGDVEGGRAEGDQRLRARLRESVAVRP